MPIDQISAVNHSDINPQVKAEQVITTPKAAQNVQKAETAARTDTVTISKQAVQLVSDGDSAAQEIKESSSEQAREKLRGKK